MRGLQDFRVGEGVLDPLEKMIFTATDKWALNREWVCHDSYEAKGCSGTRDKPRSRERIKGDPQSKRDQERERNNDNDNDNGHRENEFKVETKKIEIIFQYGQNINQSISMDKLIFKIYGERNLK